MTEEFCLAACKAQLHPAVQHHSAKLTWHAEPAALHQDLEDLVKK